MFYTRTGVPVKLVCLESPHADPVRLHRRARARRAAAAAGRGRPRRWRCRRLRRPPSILPVVEERGFEAFPAEPRGKPPQRIPLQELDTRAGGARLPRRLRRPARAPAGAADRSALRRLAAGRRRLRRDRLRGDGRRREGGASRTRASSTIAAGTLRTAAADRRAARPPPRGAQVAAGSGAHVSLAVPRPRTVPAELPRPCVPAAATARCFRPFDSLPSATTGGRWSTSRSAPSSTSSRGTSSRASLTGLQELPVEVVATVGAEIDRRSSGHCRRTSASSGSCPSPTSWHAAAPSSRTAARAASSARSRTACRRC